MSLIPCDHCRQRVPEKLCQTTWAWYGPDGNRVAYRQRLCTQCYVTLVLCWDKPLDMSALTCPGCGISTDQDMDPCYATSYLPGSGKQQLEIPTCAACAGILREAARDGGQLLGDRERVEGPGASPSTPTTRESYWASIGVLPREPEP